MFGIESIIQATGYLGIFVIVFLESGVFFGFFLPGESLLFTAGFLASQGYLNIYVLALTVFVAGVLGDSFGYFFGRRVGPRIFVKEDSLFFDKQYITDTQMYYAKNGPKTIILARFVPIVRTFAPILAGVGMMKYRTFVTYNVVGGFIWAVGFTTAGFVLKRFVPGADHYVVPIVIFIILVSILPNVKRMYQDPKTPAKLRNLWAKLTDRKV